MFEVFWLVRLFLEVEFGKLEFGLEVEFDKLNFQAILMHLAWKSSLSNSTSSPNSNLPNSISKNSLTN